MRTLKFVLAISLFLAVAVSPSAALAEDGTADDAIVFGYQNTYAPPTTVYTPLRGSTWQFSAINSKWNQPRYVDAVSYSNPHEGVDQYTNGNLLAVYPVLKGKVTAYDNVSGSGSKWLELQIDINGDGTWDNLYARYYHLSSIQPSALTIGATFNTSTQVATTGSDHLDWRLLSTISSVKRTVELYPYFLNVGGWNGAKDLDYISLYGWYQNVLSISAYVMNDGVRYEIASGNLALYWRVAGNTTWNGPVTLTRNADGNYTYNVANLASSGTSLDIIIRAKRTD